MLALSLKSPRSISPSNFISGVDVLRKSESLRRRLVRMFWFDNAFAKLSSGSRVLSRQKVCLQCLLRKYFLFFSHLSVVTRFVKARRRHCIVVEKPCSWKLVDLQVDVINLVIGKWTTRGTAATAYRGLCRGMSQTFLRPEIKTSDATDNVRL